MTSDYILRDFGQRKTRPAFPNLDRKAVAAGLFDRMGDLAEAIDQGYSSLCGPAAVMYWYASCQPENYAKYVMDLFDRGEAQFGSLTVRPGELCKKYSVNPVDIAPVDWVALASLRDSDNQYLAFKKTGNEIAGATMPDTMVRWLRAIGYQGAHHKTQLFGDFTKTDDHIIQAGSLSRHGKKVCLLIDDDMLFDQKLRHPSVIPNHWISLKQATDIDTSKRLISLQVYTWGEIVSAPAGPPGKGDLDAFLKHYYGYVVAG